MHIIKLDAIDSTNTFLRQLSSTDKVKDFTVVVTELQTNGKGQMGTQWHSEAGKNLIFSVFKDVSFIKNEDQFTVSMIVSLAIINALNKFKIPKLHIKWPNDILAENKKICGVLIENVIKNNNTTSSIIGIGLNVNQTEFKNLPKANSLKIITGVHYSTEELMLVILKELKTLFNYIQYNKATIKANYESYLFRKNKPSTFKNTKGDLFSAFILGITDQGKLKLLLEDEITKEFDLKEVTLLY